MRKLFVITGFVIVSFLLSCGNASEQHSTSKDGSRDTEFTGNDSIYNNDFNVLFVPDLSNRIDQRLHPKPVNDTVIISNIIDSVVSLIDINNRRTNQLDVYKFDFINKGILNSNICNPKDLEINLGVFDKKQIEASNYLRTGIQKDIIHFKDNIRKVYDYSQAHPAGADLWNYFNETINSSLIEEEPRVLPSSNNDSSEPIIIKQYKNLVVLFTDGYIENANKAKGYVLDPALIEKVRKEFLVSGNRDLKSFILSNPNYLLNKTNNDLHGVHVLVMEMIDRSLDKSGVALKQPTDFQIMKILWEEWLISSGAESVQLHQAVRKKEEGLAIIRKYLSNFKNQK